MAKMNGNKAEHSPSDILRKASQAEVVRALTTSNRETFECLKVFCEKYRKYQKEKSIFKFSSSSKKKMYKRVVEQAGVYVGTIEISLSVAEKGMLICRHASEALEDGDLDPKLVVDPMLEGTREALSDVKDMLRRFRSIRVALYEEMRGIRPASLLPTRESKDNQVTRHVLTAEELREMDDDDLATLTLAVLDQFVSIVSEFVNWWHSLQVDVRRLKAAIEYIRKNPDISGQVLKQWKTMEEHYNTYHEEITDQQDYYDHALKDLLPKSWIQRLLGLE